MNSPRLIIHNQINTDAFKGLVDFLNDHTGPVTIYLSSKGGDENIQHCMLDAMMSRVEDITLVASGYIASCAFNLFYSFPGKRVLLPSVIGCAHLARVEVEMSEKGKMYFSIDDAMKKYVMKFASKNTLEVLDLIGISDKDHKRVMKGEDVYFMPDQMEAFLTNSQNNYKNHE